MVEIKELSFAYKRKPNLFTGLDLLLPGGNIYGLLGKNGAGKTTLLKIISGLLFPQKGNCQVFNYASQKRFPQLLEEIYFVPEEFYIPPIKIGDYENAYSPFYPRFDHGFFADYLRNFDIPPKEKLSALSYGQKKKFLLAFGLATNCKLFILDEPTNGLDIPTKSQFRKLLASSITEDRTFLISTHQVRDMENLIDPIIILDEGKIIFHQYIHDVSKHLTVQIQHDVPDDEKVLFSEKVLGGYAVINENIEGDESKLDLEILFNAVIGNRERIEKIFGKGVRHEA